MLKKFLLLLLFLSAAGNILAQVLVSKTISKEDSLFYLKKSGKLLLLNKNTSRIKIGQIDSMLTSASAMFDKYIERNKCAIKYTYGMELSDTLFPKENKSLGIWVSPGSYFYKKTFQYGFKKLLVTKYDTVQTILRSGFSKNNMMYLIAEPSEPILSDAGSYYIDEPFELYRQSWNKEKILNLAQKIYPKKLFIGSYRWPNAHLFNLFNGNGSEYLELLKADIKLPIYIMCDEYHGNCNGGANDYWNEFRNVYGKQSNISNWINAVVNNGDGNSKRSCPYNSIESTNFYDLINNANKYGMNELWLFAYDNYWNEENIKKFVNATWRLNWLNRSGKEIVITWKCLYPSETDPCSQCNYDKQKGFWIPVKYSYTGREFSLEGSNTK